MLLWILNVAVFLTKCWGILFSDQVYFLHQIVSVVVMTEIAVAPWWIRMMNPRQRQMIPSISFSMILFPYVWIGLQQFRSISYNISICTIFGSSVYLVITIHIFNCSFFAIRSQIFITLTWFWNIFNLPNKLSLWVNRLWYSQFLIAYTVMVFGVVIAASV